jgi:hypothetical protein
LKSEAWLILSDTEFWRRVLPPEQIYDPENQRQRDAQHNASNNWKIEAAIFSLIRDIAGQSAEPEWQSSAESKESAYDHKRDSTEDK